MNDEAPDSISTSDAMRIAEALARVETKLDSVIGDHGRRLDEHTAAISKIDERSRQTAETVSALRASAPRPVWPMLAVMVPTLALIFALAKDIYLKS